MRNDTKQLVCLPACPSVAVVVFLYRLRETCVHLIFISQLVLIHNKIICMVLQQQKSEDLCFVWLWPLPRSRCYATSTFYVIDIEKDVAVFSGILASLFCEILCTSVLSLLTMKIPFTIIGPILWGHSGPLCHALSLLLSLSLSSLSCTLHAACAIAIAGVRQQRHLVNGNVTAARSGEWAQHFSSASCYPCHFGFQCVCLNSKSKMA